LAVAAVSVALSAAFAPAAYAEKFKLTLSGVFNGTTDNSTTGMGNPVITETLNAGPGGANILTTPNQPFTMTGYFDSSSPNLIAGALPPFVYSGWVSYAPTSVTLTIGGSTYSVATYTDSVAQGLSVAIFDQNQIFGPGHYAVGFIQNPVPDGAGIVGDFLTATPGYTVPNLVSTVYSDYFGVGFGNGICSGGPGSGVGCTTMPIPVDGGLYQLTLGGAEGYDLNNPANLLIPGAPPSALVNPNPNFFSASLTAVPESSTWALLLVGFAALGAARFGVGRKARLTV
jgi:hypothetical protein